MRRKIVAIVLAAALAGPVVPARAQDASAEVAWTTLAAFANLGYLPVKLGMAAGGLAVGSLMAVATGGSQRAAYAIWVPTASGDYLVRPEHIAGTEPLEFIGTDYADRPSRYRAMTETSPVYDAMYDSR
jgi:hypothetical protein